MYNREAKEYVLEEMIVEIRWFEEEKIGPSTRSGVFKGPVAGQLKELGLKSRRKQGKL